MDNAGTSCSLSFLPPSRPLYVFGKSPSFAAAAAAAATPGKLRLPPSFLQSDVWLAVGYSRDGLLSSAHPSGFGEYR